jgi:hypothetical protein
MRRQLEIAPAGIPGEALLEQRLQPPAEVRADFGLSDTDYRDGLAVRARVAHIPDSSARERDLRLEPRLVGGGQAQHGAGHRGRRAEFRLQRPQPDRDV